MCLIEGVRPKEDIVVSLKPYIVVFYFILFYFILFWFLNFGRNT